MTPPNTLALVNSGDDAYINSELICGTDALLTNYIDASPEDALVVCYTPDSRSQAALVLICAARRNVSYQVVPMMPLEDEGFRSRLSQALTAVFSSSNRVKMVTLERDTMSHSDVIRDELRKYDENRYTVHRVMSSSKELFEQAFEITPEELGGFNSALLQRFTKAERLRIKTISGSDFEVELDNSAYRWISNRGVARPRAMIVLPAGEIATYPKSINGIFVADFAFNINTICDRSVRIDSRPISFHINNGEAYGFKCLDEKLLAYLLENIGVEFGRRIGELGFGTNPTVNAPLEQNSHFNERKRGVHLGLGQHNQSANSEYHCDVHLDLIAQGGLVWVDDDPTPIDLASPPSGGVHPKNVMEEDVLSPYSVEYEGDCCGVTTCAL